LAIDWRTSLSDRLAALLENVWPLRYAGLHSIQYGLVLETGYGAELIARALRPDRAVSAGLAVAVIDLIQAAHQRRWIGMTLLRKAELERYRVVEFATHGLISGDLKGLVQRFRIAASMDHAAVAIW
jgi:hypothetical protein